MGEEDTEDMTDIALTFPTSTAQFSTPSASHTSGVSPILPTPAPSHHPVSQPLLSAFPSYPRIAVRQDLLDKQDITTIPRNTQDGRHWTITTETPMDVPGTAENIHHERPRRALLETPGSIPQTSVDTLSRPKIPLLKTPQTFPQISGNTNERRPKRTLLKTPVNVPSNPINSSLKAHHKTALETPVPVLNEQQQDDKETVMERMAQRPQQVVREEHCLASNKEKRQLTYRVEGNLLVLKTKESQSALQAKESKPDPRTVKGKTGQGSSRTKVTEVIQQATGTLETEITARAKKGQTLCRKKDQLATVKRKTQERTEKDQAVVQGEDATFPKEDQIIMERVQHLDRRLTDGEFILEMFKFVGFVQLDLA